MTEPTQERSALENIQDAMQRIEEDGKDLANFFHLYCFMMKSATDAELVRSARLFLDSVHLKKLTKVIGNEALTINKNIHQSLLSYLEKTHETYMPLLRLKRDGQITSKQEEQLKACAEAIRFLIVALHLLEIDMGIRSEEGKLPSNESKATWWQFWR
jgi:hypothetical protein